MNSMWSIARAAIGGLTTHTASTDGVFHYTRFLYAFEPFGMYDFHTTFLSFRCVAALVTGTLTATRFRFEFEFHGVFRFKSIFCTCVKRQASCPHFLFSWCPCSKFEWSRLSVLFFRAILQKRTRRRLHIVGRDMDLSSTFRALSFIVHRQEPRFRWPRWQRLEQVCAATKSCEDGVPVVATEDLHRQHRKLDPEIQQRGTF